MQKDWLRKLRSPLRTQRMEIWNELRHEIMQSQITLDRKQRKELAEIYDREQEMDVEQAARKTLLILAVLDPLALVEEVVSTDKGWDCLADWLWDPFKNRSVILNVSDPRQIRRDECALLPLVSNLAKKEIPDVPRLAVELGDPHWQSLWALRPSSLCIIGRMGLYGRDALNWWSLADPQFAFVMHERPKKLPFGVLDSEYHCIRERLPDGQDRYYQTRDNDGRRTDYCLVQRYVVKDGTNTIVIVICAGPTSLGTQGAVAWAAEQLPWPTRPDGQAIPPPKDLEYESRLEALLEVTAEITNGTWSPNPGKLISLRVDDWVWNADESKWQLVTPSHIRVCLRDGDSNQPVAIYLDGKVTNMVLSSDTFRLLARLAWRWDRCGTEEIPLEDLAKDSWIWGGKEVELDTVHDRLKTLKSRYLREALKYRDSALLLAEVVIEGSPEAGGFTRPPQADLAPVAAPVAQSKSTRRNTRRPDRPR